MPAFTYIARDAQGARQKGRITAMTASDAAEKIKARDLLIVKIDPVHTFRIGSSTVKMSLKDKVVLTEQLAVMIKAGLPISKALQAMLNQSFSKPIREMLGAISTQVEGGISFAEALEQYHDTFGRVYIKMVQAGEKGGKLDDILEKLALQLQKDYEIRGKIRSALMYPIIILLLMAVVIVVIMIFVIPRLTLVFTESGVALPTPTKILIGTSNFFVAHGVILLIAVAVAVIAVKLLLHVQKISLLWDTIKVRIPIYGPFVVRVYMARFSLTFASLISSGLPILEILGTSSDVIDNRAYQRELADVAKNIENGMPIATALGNSHYFPNMISQLVSVGEKSGSLEDIMWVIAHFYEKEVDAVSQNLSTALEPIIMIVLGVGVAFILISVLQPMYSLVSAI